MCKANKNIIPPQEAKPKRKMKEYFKNLGRAIIGKDPAYREAYLKQVVETEQQKQAAENYENLYQNADRRFHAKEDLMDKTILSINQQVLELRKTLESVSQELKEAREDSDMNTKLLEQMQKEQAQMLMDKEDAVRAKHIAQQLLDKTNTTIKDMLVALKSGETEKIKECLYRSAWSPSLHALLEACSSPILQQ